MTLRAVPLALLWLIVASACGSRVYLSSPTKPPVTVAPSNVASPTTSVQPSPSSSGVASPGESAELFFIMFGGVPPPFHVQVDTALSGSPSGIARTEADVDGADYSAQLHVELEGSPAQDSQIVVVDGTGYVADLGSVVWRAYPDYETVPPVNPFLDLDPGQWQEMGADATRAGLYHLHSTSWRLPAGSSPADRVTEVNFDLWIDDEGLPVSAELAFSLAATDGTSAAGYRASYAFERMGEPVLIAPPIPGAQVGG